MSEADKAGEWRKEYPWRQWVEPNPDAWEEARIRYHSKSTSRPSPVLTPAQWRALYAHEQVYREMAEQQAETRDARRNRAMNRPRGRAGTYKYTE